MARSKATATSARSSSTIRRAKQLTGTPFGSSPAWNNDSSTFDKAFDGDTTTFFDFVSAHYGFTGIDLGSGNASAVGSIRFFPRAGYEARMNGTNYEGLPPRFRFEGSNVAPVTETVVAEVQAGYGSGAGQVVTRTVNYVTPSYDPARRVLTLNNSNSALSYPCAQSRTHSTTSARSKQSLVAKPSADQRYSCP